MKGILFILLITFTAAVLHAQNVSFVWAKQIAGPGAIVINSSIATDASGNVYTTGSFVGTVDFDPGTGIFNVSSSGTSSIFVSKLDAAGNFIWARQMGGYNSNARGYSIAVDAAGNVYTSGKFIGTVDFDPGAGVFNLSTLSSIFVSKLDSAGSFIWAKQMEGSYPYEAEGNLIAVDASGNVYITGSFNGTTDFDPGRAVFSLSAFGGNDIFVLKLNAAGRFAWARQMEGSGAGAISGGISIATDASGNVYTTGSFNGTVDFDPGADVFSLSSAINRDIFVSKLDAAGNFVWARQMGGTGFAEGLSIAVDASGNVYTTGKFNGIADFDPGVGTSNFSSVGDWDFFVSKLDAAGNFVWAKQTGGTSYDIGFSVALDVLGNVYTTGSFGGTVDFDPGPGVFNLSSVGYEDIFVSKLDGDGKFVWAKHMGGPQFDNGSSVSVDLSGNVYTTGGFTSHIIDFDPGAGVFNFSLVGATDIFVHKMAACANSSSTINTSICPGQNYSGYTTGGTYVDTLIAANGCDSIRTINLTVLHVNPSLGKDTSICPGDALTLFPGQFTGYIWQDGSIESHYIVKQAGLYSVNVTNQCGSGVAEILITEKACGIYFPSAFTPNEDGKNDLFKILNAPHLNDYNLVIFNRWGEKVFETKDYTKGWDGKVNAQLSGTGVYVWRCKFKKSNNPENIEMKGTVMLIR